MNFLPPTSQGLVKMTAATEAHDRVREATDLIDQAHLPYPSVQIVAGFVRDALDSELAAEYVIQACHEAADQQVAISTLASDWRDILNSGQPALTRFGTVFWTWLIMSALQQLLMLRLHHRWIETLMRQSRGETASYAASQERPPPPETP